MPHLHLLGGFVVEDGDGAGLTGRAAQRKRLGLLALLAASPTPTVSRDKLAAYLWPDADADRARHQLAAALYDLRRALGDDVILAQGDDLRLNPALVTSDVRAFHEAVGSNDLEQAVQLYRGPFLDGFFVSDVPEFEQWVESERQRFATSYAGVLEELAERRAAAGDFTGAAESWRRLAGQDPYNARVATRLMEALDSAGDRAGALGHAQVHEALLREQLAIGPDVAVAALAERLRRTPVGANPLVTQPRSEPTLGAPEAAAVESGSETSRFRVRLHTARRSVILALSVTAITLAGGIVLQSAAQREGAALDGSGLERERVLVATLENRTGDHTLDPVGKIAADWITRGIARTELVEVIDPATALLASIEERETIALADPSNLRILAEATGAGTILWGGYHLRGDSIEFHVQVMDAVQSRLVRTLQPVASPKESPLAALEPLQGQVMGALSLIFDERLATLVTPVTAPPDFEAYEEYIEGLELFVKYQYARSLPYFHRAFAIDSSFVLPLIWAAFAHGNSGDSSGRDSIVRFLEPRRERLSRLDRHALDYFVADATGDRERALEAARAAARLAPRSNWTYMVGLLLLRQDRAREAVQALETLDPESGWAKGWASYTIALADAYHAIEEHERELHLITRARERDPENHGLFRGLLPALAALGRIEELEAAVLQLESLPIKNLPTSVRPGWNFHEAGVELRAHGHAEEARRILERSLEWELANSDERQAMDSQSRIARTLYQLGRFDEARPMFAHLAAEGHLGLQRNMPGYLGAIAARVGDRDEAEAISAWFADMAVKEPGAIVISRWHRARIAALLGQKAKAVSLLRLLRARGQLGWEAVHRESDFDSLRGDPEFQALFEIEG